ncbi:MAG: ATP-binding protein [Clostridia bacterium]|nr:ATP-binding protein [Clostridia bacterium]
MPYKREIFEKAQEILDKRRNQAEAKNTAVMMMFENTEPLYREYKNEMIASVKEAVKAIDMSPDKAAAFIEEQKIRNLTAQQNVKRLLEKHGLPEDYLEVKYSCPECDDTGVVGTRLCSCHIQLLKDLAYEEAGKKSPLKICTFEDFKLSYYSDKGESSHDASPRERMAEILKFCRQYADSFDRNAPSVLMAGQTGLGKTHLSLAIVGKVIEKGYSVLYNSAQNFFRELQNERFGKSGSSAFENMMLECDLLVIDDLGAEFSTSFTVSALYNIVNTRINTGLPTIISTNLSLTDIEKQYSNRISSRFIGEYSILFFEGKDIRQIKNEED